MAPAAQRNGDRGGVGHAGNGAGGYGVAHGTAAPEVGEGNAHRGHRLKQGAHHGVRAGVPSGGGDGHGLALHGLRFKQADGFDNPVVDVEAVHGVIALAEQIARDFGDLAGRGAQQHDIRLAGHGFQIRKTGVFRNAAQIVRILSKGFFPANDAHAGETGLDFQRFDGVTSDIAQTHNGSFYWHFGLPV